MRCLIVAAALVAVALAADQPSLRSSFDLQASFDLADANKDGIIQKAEFDGLYSTFDDNGDSFINATEFVTHFVQTGMSVEGSLYIFFKMDKNDDLFVDIMEVSSTFATFDADSDNQVSNGEYTGVMMVILNELSIAQAVGIKLDQLYSAADLDMDGNLSGDELFGLLGKADADDNKLIDLAEFKKYWMANTDEPEDRTEAFFALLDRDNSGSIGEPDERLLIFAAFDHNSDASVSKEEFDRTMLFYFHKVIENLEAAGKSAFSVDFQQLFDTVDANDDASIDLSEFEAVFLKGDKDMNGELNAGEYMKLFEAQGLTDKEALFAFFLSDMNDDNSLDKAEMKSQFGKFDKNGDGQVVFEEYKETEMVYIDLINKASAAGAKFAQLVEGADADGDNMLSFDDAFKVVSAADKNGDGIDMSEFEMFFMSKTGVSKELSDGFFQAFDRDMSGMVGGDAEIKQVFSSFDYDKDGQLSKDEYLNAMIFIYAYNVKNRHAQKIKVFSVEEAFKGLDNNTDGFISVDEFSSFAGINITDFIRYNVMSGMDQTASLYIFFRLDSNEDDVLSKSELESAFHGIDMNDDDNVDLSEYSASINMTFTKLAEAKVTGEKLAVLFNKADSDMDKELTRDEMASIFVDADEDKDGLVSEDEFKKFWKLNTNEPDDRTDLLFGYLDEDSDGFFGDDNERTNLFNAFDYGDDGMVSHEEFNNAMLFLFARAVGDLEMAAAAQQIVGYFF